jgi:hypothetical protein
MMEAARSSETSVDNFITRQHIPEDNSEYNKLFITTEDGHLTAERRTIYQ